MAEERFLVVRLGSLGDIVHTFPAVAALRETFADRQITWLTHPRWQPLIRAAGLVSEVWATETRSLASIRAIMQRIRSGHFTTAIDYQGLWKSAALPLFAGVKRRIGFSSETIREYGVPILYTDRVRCTTTHIADQNGELSLRADSRRGVAEFALHVPERAEASVRQFLRERSIDRYVVLSPGGGWRSKCWPAERYGVLCQRIFRVLGLRCVVNGGPGEEDLAATLCAVAGEARPHVYSGDLDQLMALLKNSRCLVGGDTGPLHLGIALGTPAVALFGPTDPARNGPYRSDAMVLRAAGAKRDHSRKWETDPSMLAIEVDAVFDAVSRRIGALV
jgi:lipopolysaccharide heptosyltransferase I